MIEPEFLIARSTIERILAAGYQITVIDDYDAEGETVLTDSTDLNAILDVMFSTGGDTLLCKLPQDSKPKMLMFIWGNGEDCVHDYSVSLEPYINP
jgi:hypothetical protein